MRLNTALAPFDDVNVRRAVVAGFDRLALRLALGGERAGTFATHILLRSADVKGVANVHLGGWDLSFTSVR